MDVLNVQCHVTIPYRNLKVATVQDRHFGKVCIRDQPATATIFGLVPECEP